MSSKLTAIRWVGGQRFVPRVGLVSKGHILDVPAVLDAYAARDLIRQGLAEAYAPKSKNEKE